jgi:hypothetical protein
VAGCRSEEAGAAAAVRGGSGGAEAGDGRRRRGGALQAPGVAAAEAEAAPEVGAAALKRFDTMPEQRSEPLEPSEAAAARSRALSEGEALRGVPGKGAEGERGVGAAAGAGAEGGEGVGEAGRQPKPKPG